MKFAFLKPVRFTSKCSKMYCTSLMSSHISHLYNKDNGAEIFLVGTKHVFERCSKDVQNLISEVRPDAVMIELDPIRRDKLVERFRSDGQMSDSDFARSFIVPRDINFNIFESLLRKFYDYLRFLGLVPGKEFYVALQEAEKLNAEVILGDRDINVTISRIKLQDVVANFMGSFLSSLKNPDLKILKDFQNFNRGDQRENFYRLFESMHNRKDVDDITDLFRQRFPAIAKVLIDERDLYMISQLKRCNKKKIVAVVGIGHLTGIEKYWDRFEERREVLKMKHSDF